MPAALDNMARPPRGAAARAMSNPQLNRLLRGGGLTSFHVGASSVGRDVAREASVFNGERFAFSADVKDNHNFEKKENREESGGEKRTKGDSDSESDDDGPHFNSDGIHAKSSDAGALRTLPLARATLLTPSLLCRRRRQEEREEEEEEARPERQKQKREARRF